MRISTNVAVTPLHKKREVDGKEYLVVPVVAVVAGVLNGETLTIDEIEKSLSAWDRVPVTLNHPETETGVKVSVAEQPDFIVGIFKNPVIKGNKLVGEVWIEGHDALIAAIIAGEKFGISTGYFANVKGGNQYDIAPDHLAILPDEEGACSWADGCGFPRTNNRSAANMEKKKMTELTLEKAKELIENAKAEKLIVDQSLADMKAKLEQAIVKIDDAEARSIAAEEALIANEDSGGDQDDDGDDSDAEIPEEIVKLMEALDALGGADGIVSALAALKDNRDEVRTGLVDEIIANSDLTADDLTNMDTDAIGKLATTIRPANYSSARTPRMNTSEWVVYEDVGAEK